MRTDSIFYKIFQTLPETLFAFIGESVELAKEYEFKSIELKELSFRIDGVFISENPENLIYFLEVQFQKDTSFYWRFFNEIFTYFKQYQPTQDWEAVVIFAKRSIEPDFPLPIRRLLPHLRRIYLDELSIDPHNAIGINIAELVIIQENETIEAAKQLITQTRSQFADSTFQAIVLELIKTILVYKLGKDKEQELKTMFTKEELRNTWLVQEFAEEAKQEGLQQGLQEGLQQGLQEGLQEGIRQVAANLLQLGISVEQVSVATGLTITQIQNL